MSLLSLRQLLGLASRTHLLLELLQQLPLAQSSPPTLTSSPHAAEGAGFLLTPKPPTGTVPRRHCTPSDRASCWLGRGGAAHVHTTVRVTQLALPFCSWQSPCLKSVEGPGGSEAPQ